MKEVHLIVVGKLKEKNILELEDDYKKRIKGFKLIIHELKGGNDDIIQEGILVKKKIDSLSKNPRMILLSEWGDIKTSNDFSHDLYKDFESHDQLFFLIGGAAGHGPNILERPHKKLSLGKMTYPHKLARLLFVEQLYRAETIKEGHPYSK